MPACIPPPPPSRTAPPPSLHLALPGSLRVPCRRIPPSCAVSPQPPSQPHGVLGRVPARLFRPTPTSCCAHLRARRCARQRLSFKLQLRGPSESDSAIDVDKTSTTAAVNANVRHVDISTGRTHVRCLPRQIRSVPPQIVDRQNPRARCSRRAGLFAWAPSRRFCGRAASICATAPGSTTFCDSDSPALEVCRRAGGRTPAYVLTWTLNE